MSRFDSFVMFAEMRTGSNLLEANLNALDGVSCLGEVFNPHFVGYPKRDECLGTGLEARDRDPAALLQKIRAQPGLAGFRYFHDHDPRVADMALADPRCAKIILTRNPVESYVSWKIARATDQWKMTDVRRRREAQAVFVAAEFEEFLSEIHAFQQKILRALQVSGQSGFYIAYEDLQELDVINGLAAFLGVGARLEELDGKLKVQNPEPLSAKVSNFAEMEQALAGLDRFDLSRTPNFEPRRGPQVKGLVAARRAPLLWMPLRGGPVRQVQDWLGQFGGVKDDFNRKTLKEWLGGQAGHRCFAVVRHPLARAHAVFCDKILRDGPGSFSAIRKTLRNRYALPLPDSDLSGYDAAAHHAAFAAFLDFMKMNLSGQTTIRVDPHWASQSAQLEALAPFCIADAVIREDEMSEALPALAARMGADVAPPAAVPPDQPFSLSEIYDDTLEARAADIWSRDYATFGFGPWKG